MSAFPGSEPAYQILTQPQQTRGISASRRPTYSPGDFFPQQQPEATPMATQSTPQGAASRPQGSQATKAQERQSAVMEAWNNRSVSHAERMRNIQNAMNKRRVWA